MTTATQTPTPGTSSKRPLGQFFVYAREASTKRWGFQEAYYHYGADDAQKTRDVASYYYDTCTPRCPTFQIVLIKVPAEAFPPHRLSNKDLRLLDVHMVLPTGAL